MWAEPGGRQETLEIIIYSNQRGRSYSNTHVSPSKVISNCWQEQRANMSGSDDSDRISLSLAARRLQQAAAPPLHWTGNYTASSKQAGKHRRDAASRTAESWAALGSLQVDHENSQSASFCSGCEEAVQ